MKQIYWKIPPSSFPNILVSVSTFTISENREKSAWILEFSHNFIITDGDYRFLTLQPQHILQLLSSKQWFSQLVKTTTPVETF